MKFDRISSPVAEVHFAGWRSDTKRLQSAGWEISMQQDHYGQSLQLAMRHEKLGLIAVSDHVENYEFRRLEPSLSRFPYIFNIVSMSMFGSSQILPQMKFHVHEPSSAWSPIDAEPAFEVDCVVKSLDDLLPFRKIHVPPECELIVDPDSINQMMKRIIDLQAPKQKEIREKARKEKRRSNVEAQIITLAV